LIILNLSEILPVYLVGRLYPSVMVIYQQQILHIWSSSKSQKINCYMWKICCRIWQTGPQNLDKNFAENFGAKLVDLLTQYMGTGRMDGWVSLQLYDVI